MKTQAMGIDLAYKYFGQEGKTPLVILHGLMGSSRNWSTVGRELSSSFEVFAPDFRNHGSSPHIDPMNYEVLVEDVFTWLKKRDLSSVILMGHSMGGKVAMSLATQYPTLVRALVVVDMAPKEYGIPAYAKYLQALIELDLASITKREEADQLLKEKIPNDFFRRFLLSGLVRDEGGIFKWQNNIPLLIDSLSNMVSNSISSEDGYQGPALFIRGENSDYIEEPDYSIIKWHFKQSTIFTIPNSGHYPHIDNREAFISTFYQFTRRVLGKVA